MYLNTPLFIFQKLESTTKSFCTDNRVDFNVWLTGKERVKVPVSPNIVDARKVLVTVSILENISWQDNQYLFKEKIWLIVSSTKVILLIEFFDKNPTSDKGLESISITWSISSKFNVSIFELLKAPSAICLILFCNLIVEFLQILLQSLKAHLPMFSSELGNIIVSKSKDSQPAKA